MASSIRLMDYAMVSKLGQYKFTEYLLSPEKLSFRMEGQRKCFPGKVKLKEFIITKPLLYEMSKGLV